MDIRLKRAYDPPQPDDGFRILIDRVWPRGVRKEDLQLDEWRKDLAPSTELREWFGHDPQKWDEFRHRYFQELDAHPDETRELRAQARQGPLTIVFGSKEERFNNAVALQEYLEHPRTRSGVRQAGGGRRPGAGARRQNRSHART